MKKVYSAGLVLLILAYSSCGSKSEKTLADYYEANPGQAELTANKKIKERTARENRKRVQYYNSLQHR